MKPTEVLHELRLVQKKFEDEKSYTFGLRISDMARDAANALEEVMAMQGQWIPVEKMLPPKPEYDWVLVRVVFTTGGEGPSVPHIGELQCDGWHFMDYEYGPAEEALGVKVTHWIPLLDDPSPSAKRPSFIGIDLANGSDLMASKNGPCVDASIYREGEGSKKSMGCLGCDYDRVTDCTCVVPCIRDEKGYLTGYKKRSK